jgi:hypothetical protein
MKNEQAEDIIMSQDTFISKFMDTVNKADAKLKQIDHKGSFESDDEIGFFFKEVKNIQATLNEFNNKLTNYNLIDDILYQDNNKPYMVQDRLEHVVLI